MKSFITLPIVVILFQNKNWSIEQLSEKEIAISDGFNVYYGWPDLKNNLIRYDSVNFPKYIKAKALSLAKKHNINFY